MKNYKELPVFKTIDITEKADLTSFKKYELGMFKINKFVAIALLLGGGYLFAVHVLPTLFIVLSRILAAAITGIAVVGLFIMWPVIVKGIRRLTRHLHKMLINIAPFEELYDAIAKLHNDLKSVDNSIGTIKRLENDTANNATAYEQTSERLKEQINQAKKNIDKYRERKQEILKSKGQDALFDDEYVKYDIAERELSSETMNIARQQKQAEELIVKYGARHKIMKATRIKMQKVRSFMKIKISETETTVKILEVDYKFAKEGSDAMAKANAATKGLEGSWNVEYALEVVSNSIQADLHKMSVSIKEIEALAGDFNLDNDAMYDRLLSTVESINTKEAVSADKFMNPNYELTEKEKVQSGLNGLFN